MTFATDQKLNLDNLSGTSQRMHALRDTVLLEWEKKVRAAFKEAKVLRHPVFINTIPAFYDNIVEAVTPEYPRASATDASSLASAHGEERARLTSYDPEVLILEYQIFRSTILQVLEQHGVALNADEILVINTSIDNAIREAVTAFSLATAAMREQFVAALTHDLRNPLASANLAAELIAHAPDLARARELAGKIIENHRRMEGMIQSLLDTMLFQSTKRLHLDLSCFDILDVAKEVCEQPMGVQRPQFEIAGASVQGWWGREAMKRAIENLVGNAVKYGTSDTPVRIKVDEVHQRLLMSVHNEGDPIPPEEQETIFQVFRRALAAKEGKKQGWGIGLPYVRAVAESHGGSVVVDSSVERGTTFQIDIPIDARPFQNEAILG